MIIKADDMCYWQKGLNKNKCTLDFTEEIKDATLLLLTHLFEHNINDVELMLLSEYDVECTINYKNKKLIVITTDNYFYHLNEINRFDHNKRVFNYDQIIDHINEYFEIG